MRERSVAGFVGRYEHSLDAKGRVILPAKFRAAFERGGYLRENREGCLALWTLGEFERQMAAMQERAASGQTDRNRARLWASTPQEVEVDRQGRMAITAQLREFADLENDVSVIGAIDRIELWNPARLGGAGAAGRAVVPRGRRRGRERSEQTRNATTAPCQSQCARYMRSPSTGTVEDSSSALFPVGRPGNIPEIAPRPSGGCGWTGTHCISRSWSTRWSSCSRPCPAGVVVDAHGRRRRARRRAALGAPRHLGCSASIGTPMRSIAARSRLAPFGDRGRSSPTPASPTSSVWSAKPRPWQATGEVSARGSSSISG